MNEERMSILRMLADGKITPEEADELLEALERSEEKEEPEAEPVEAVEGPVERHEEEEGWKAQGWIAGGPEEQTVEAPEVIHLVVEGEGGSLSIRGTEETSVRIKGSAGVDKQGETLRIFPSYHSVSLEVPGTINLIQASEDGGSVTIENVPADIQAKADGGEVSLKNISGGSVKVSADGGSVQLSGISSPGIQASADGGSILLELGGIREGSLKLDVTAGRADLIFSEDAAFELLADIGPDTKLHSDLTLEMLKRSSDRIHARFNDGGAIIRLDAGAATVNIKSQ